MSRPLHVALEEDAAVAERGLRLAAGCLDGLAELRSVADDPHPAPAAARRRLDHQREPELLGLARRNDRHVRLGRDALRLQLVAAEPQRLGRAGRRRPGRRPRQPRRTPGSPRGTRSRDGSRRRRSASRRGCAPRSRGSRRSRPSRPPSGRGARRDRRAPTTATVAIPSSRAARNTRSAISPRFATRSFWIAIGAQT